MVKASVSRLKASSVCTKFAIKMNGDNSVVWVSLFLSLVNLVFINTAAYMRDDFPSDQKVEMP
jgi:hypothetical protein